MLTDGSLQQKNTGFYYASLSYISSAFIPLFSPFSLPFSYCSGHTITYKNPYNVCVIYSSICCLATRLFVIWSDTHNSGSLCYACCSFYSCSFHLAKCYSMRRLRLCSVSDDAWRNELSRKINCIATALTPVYTFERANSLCSFRQPVVRLKVLECDCLHSHGEN